jgi:transcriptional regulator with XRE-family HTH domain
MDAYKDFLEGIGEFSETTDSPPSQQSQEGVSGNQLSVGERVRSVRTKKGLTKADIKQRTGIDETYLDEIESGNISPPLGVLIKIAKALNMELGRFISSGKIKPFTIVRKGKSKTISRFTQTRDDQYGYTYESLAPDKKDRHMEPFMVTLIPSGAKKELSSHAGQEFIHVLDGDMEVTLGNFTDILHPGDSIYYDSTVPHLVRCHGEKETIILAVLYTE